MLDVAIFGFKDSLVGQFLEIFDINQKFNIRYFISIDPLPYINTNYEHKKRPNDKTEFVVNDKIFGKPVYEDSEYINRLKKDNIYNVIVLEDENYKRYEIIKKLIESNFNILTFIHNTVFIGGNNDIGPGTIIFPMSYVSYKTDIGMGTIIQSNTILEHHNVIGKCCNINSNVTTGGFTFIGNFSTIHISTTIINRINIGDNCVIGAGSLVLKDCDKNSLYYGLPAKKIRPS